MMLMIYGVVSKFNLKYFSGVMDDVIKEILHLVVPFPFESIKIREYLDINQELTIGVVPIQIIKNWRQPPGLLKMAEFKSG